MPVESIIYDISTGNDEYIDSRIAERGTSDVIDIFKPSRIVAFCPYEDTCGAVFIKDSRKLNVRLFNGDNDRRGTKIKSGINSRTLLSGDQVLSISSRNVAIDIVHVREEEVTEDE